MRAQGERPHEQVRLPGPRLRHPRLPGARRHLQGHHAPDRRPPGILGRHRRARGALPGPRHHQGRGRRGPRLPRGRTRGLPPGRRLRPGQKARQAPPRGHLPVLRPRVRHRRDPDPRRRPDPRRQGHRHRRPRGHRRHGRRLRPARGAGRRLGGGLRFRPRARLPEPPRRHRRDLRPGGLLPHRRGLPLRTRGTRTRRPAPGERGPAVFSCRGVLDGASRGRNAPGRRLGAWPPRAARASRRRPGCGWTRRGRRPSRRPPGGGTRP